MQESTFPVSLDLRLDWSELDLYGHINNVSFFKYLQASRINYWEKVAMEKLYDSQGLGPMLASTRCDFKKPLHYPGTITIRASVVEMRRTSFSIMHLITDEEGTLAAEGQDVIVLFNYRRGVKESIPNPLRSSIEMLEKRVFPVAADGKNP